MSEAVDRREQRLQEIRDRVADGYSSGANPEVDVEFLLAEVDGLTAARAGISRLAQGFKAERDALRDRRDRLDGGAWEALEARVEKAERQRDVLADLELRLRRYCTAMEATGDQGRFFVRPIREALDWPGQEAGQ